MEVVVIFILLAGFILAAAIVVAAQSGSRASGWSQAFEHAARRFHGKLMSGGWLSQPSAWLQHGQSSARLTVVKLPRSGGERYLQMTIQQPDFRSRCEIFYYQTRPELIQSMRGLAAVEFDWDEFRTRWHVLAADGDEVRHCLSDGVRLAIDQLWRLPVPGEAAISLSPGWLVVRKMWGPPRGAELEEFVERVCALHDQLCLAAAAGIEFIASDQAQLLEAARCGVCGDSLAAEIVVCKRCNTPHHRDCWDYGGTCATYGCGSRECFYPGLAPLAAPHWSTRSLAEPRPAKPR
ncbi:MAG TPA: RING finger protein [Pirellulaceae bacterium]|nr:RING finger protein [Pirellulaceae bacterium]